MRIDGTRIDGRLYVEVDGAELTPTRSQKLWNHSPDGFECGYAGSGPAQLALAVLLAAGVDDDVAARRHQQFKADYVQHWQAPFSEVVDVRDWLANYD